MIIDCEDTILNIVSMILDINPGSLLYYRYFILDYLRFVDQMFIMFEEQNYLRVNEMPSFDDILLKCRGFYKCLMQDPQKVNQISGQISACFKTFFSFATDVLYDSSKIYFAFALKAIQLNNKQLHSRSYYKTFLGPKLVLNSFKNMKYTEIIFK